MVSHGKIEVFVYLNAVTLSLNLTYDLGGVRLLVMKNLYLNRKGLLNKIRMKAQGIKKKFLWF